MKRLQITFTLALIAVAACKSTTVVDPIIINAVSPTIAGFDQDTAWTFSRIKIYGTNFGYDPRDVPVRIDTAQAEVVSVFDTVMTVIVPEYARTGYVYVTKLSETNRSPKRLNVNYSFNPHAINDRVLIGAFFSIPGTGLSNHKGPIKIKVNDMLYPVDSVSDDRIVSHVLANGSSGQVFISDSGGYHDSGYLHVNRQCSWKTVTAIWDHLVMSEQHRLMGYLNGPGHIIDSMWTVTTTYDSTLSWDVTGSKFERKDGLLSYDVGRTGEGEIVAYWDTVTHTFDFTAEFNSNRYSTTLRNQYTHWYSVSASATIKTPVDYGVDAPVQDFRKQVVDDSTDQTGLVKYREVTNSTIVSGSFRIRFVQ